MNVLIAIVRITIVTRSSSVGRSGFHATLRLSSNTGEGHTARTAGEDTETIVATRTRHARTSGSLISHPHRDLLPRPELDPVPDHIRDPEPRESRERVSRVREVHDGEARRGRGRRRGGGGGRGRRKAGGPRGGRGRWREERYCG